MELPFTVVFEPPSQDELRAVMRMRGIWVAGLLVVLAIGAWVVLASVRRAEAIVGDTAVSLQLTSRPDGARVWLDGREQGPAPLAVQVGPGLHNLLFKAPNALDGQYTVHVGADGAALEAVLWRRQPTVVRLRPALPGAVLADVRFLASGELALSLALPPGRQLQAWRLDPLLGGLEPILPDAVGTRVALAADGQHVAYTGYEIGPAAPGSAAAVTGEGRAAVLWLVAGGHAAPAAPAEGWRPPLRSGEYLLDASWSPGAERLLAVTGEQQAGGGTHSRLWLVDAETRTARQVLSLPSEVVPGSQVWSPDGKRVAFVAHARGLSALCLVDLEGGFRYLADLDPAVAAPLAYPAASWSADSQRLLFVAPRQRPPAPTLGWSLQPDARLALYVATSVDTAPLLLGDTDVDRATWREDGQMLGLGRGGGDGTLALRLLSGANGTSQQLLQLPLKLLSRYAAAWDVGHARLLIASSAGSGAVDYWLALLGLEGVS